MHGHGMMKFCLFSAEFDKFSSAGVFRFASEAFYDVTHFISDVLVVRIADIMILHSQGEWFKNKFQGRGKYQWPTGAHYVGDWVENKYVFFLEPLFGLFEFHVYRMHGTGVYTDGEGRQWNGKFHNGSGPGLIHV